MNTGKGASHAGVCWGNRGGTVRSREVGLGRVTWGEMPDIGDRRMEEANDIDMYVPIQLTVLHDLHMYART